jgi:hypothetical protein
VNHANTFSGFTHPAARWSRFMPRTPTGYGHRYQHHAAPPPAGRYARRLHPGFGDAFQRVAR